ncbi:MAG: hypothetical protein ACRERS_11005, partial [Methylococcales bacterium]
LQVYAPYCAVLGSDFHQNLSRCVCLPGDSLELCYSGTSGFGIAAVRQSTVSYSHMHWLVTHNRIKEIDPTPRTEWPQLLISTDSKRYFEVIFIGDIGLKVLKCVRVKADEYQKMWELAFANFGRSLPEADRAWVQDFVQLVRAHKDGKMQIEVIT